MAKTATAISHPNIAFIKYWGNVDQQLRLPASGSISMNLAGLETLTSVTFDSGLKADEFMLNGKPAEAQAAERVSRFLDRVRGQADIADCARVESENNFPTGAGIASSASAFAALSVAASAAAGLSLETEGLSRLARLGSGSASRSVPGGFVEWKAGDTHETSYSFSIAPPDHWHLTDCIAIVSQSHKPTGSTQGHALADTSPLQAARLADAPRRLDDCRRALLARDFAAFAKVVEQDSNLMHAVMMTSTPPLFYWQPETLAVMQAVRAWRNEGLEACYTVDAGPNVHVLCPSGALQEVTHRLTSIPGVQRVITAAPGAGARLVESPAKQNS